MQGWHTCQLLRFWRNHYDFLLSITHYEFALLNYDFPIFLIIKYIRLIARLTGVILHVLQNAFVFMHVFHTICLPYMLVLCTYYCINFVIQRHFRVLSAHLLLSDAIEKYSQCHLTKARTCTQEVGQRFNVFSSRGSLCTQCLWDRSPVRSTCVHMYTAHACTRCLQSLHIVLRGQAQLAQRWMRALFSSKFLLT